MVLAFAFIIKLVRTVPGGGVFFPRSYIKFEDPLWVLKYS